MVFLTFSKIEMDFAEKKLTWKAYTTTGTLFITKRAQIIVLKEFVKTALDPKQEAFIVYITTFFMEIIKVHLDHKV